MNRNSFYSSHSVRLSLAVAAVVTAALSFRTEVSAQPARQDANLLVNGGFEWPYNQDSRGDGGGMVAHGWTAWWYNDPGNEYDGPEFKGASIEEDRFRVRDGVVAQQYFKPSARHKGGLYQRVAVPAGSHVRFTVWGHAWTTFCETIDGSLKCDPRNSHYGGANNIVMKVGVDPTGGTDPFSSAIVWSASQAAYDNYSQFAVEADAQAEAVTVYVFSEPEWAAPVINVYWDNAVLTAAGGSARPQPTSAPASASSNNPGAGNSAGNIATQAPNEDGSQWHTVQSGETLGEIALAYSVDTQTIVSQNNLTTNTIYAGQELLIRPATQPTDITLSAEPTGEAVTSPPTASPAAVADQPSQPTNRICLRLFDDTDSNGLLSEGEAPLPGGSVAIGGPASEGGATGDEPTCFENLPAGDYEVTVDAPGGYHMTGLSRLPVTLSEGGDIHLSFGAAPGEAENEAPPVEESAQQPQSTIGLFLGGAALMLILAGGGGIAAVLLMYRRQRTQPSDEVEPSKEQDV